MPAPEFTGEVGRAAGYTALAAGLLKGAQIALRFFASKRVERVSEMTVLLEAQGKLREELRKDNEQMRERVDELEDRLAHVEEELRKSRARTIEVEAENRLLRTEKLDLEAEIRLWKRGLRSPHPHGDGG